MSEQKQPQSEQQQPQSETQAQIEQKQDASPPPPEPPPQKEQPSPQESPAEAELKKKLSAAEAQIAEYKQKLQQFESVVSNLIKAEIDPLPEAERKLIEELAGGDDPLEQLRVLRVLKAQGKISKSANPISRPDANEAQQKPSSLEEARRAVIRALNN